MRCGDLRTGAIALREAAGNGTVEPLVQPIRLRRGREGGLLLSIALRPIDGTADSVNAS
jgi:hypothetical protein